jgi:tetratricopeptide (TPR) repeat protein
MNAIRQVVREAHRRSLWQVLGVYLALSWGVYQVVKELTQLFGLPDWVPGFAIVLLLIGLPVVMATAFVQEGGPGQKESAAPADPTLMPMFDATPATPAPPRQRSQFFLTWQKAVLGGISAFLLLGITAGGYMGMRNAGVGPFGSLVASGELNARAPILIADFKALNGDSILARTVTEVFRVDFTQSDVVTVVQPAHVRGVLQRMSRDVATPIDADLAHEIAIRDNIKAYLVGELSQAGSKYIVSAKIIATKDSRVLASYRETAANADDIIPAVDRLSKKLRNKIGESFKTIRAEKPLELVSTSSLEALHKYTQGAYAVDVERDFDTGISLLEEAIGLDSAFAMAWRKLGVAYANSGISEDKRRRAVLKAYDFRDRLPDIERYSAIGMYFYSLKRDDQKALSAYEMLMERDPAWPPNNLGIVYLNLRDYQKAAQTFKRAIAIDSTLTSSYLNLIDVYIDSNQPDSARQAIRLFVQRFGADRPEVNEKEFFLATAYRDYDKAELIIKGGLAEARSPFWVARVNHSLADIAMVHGQTREADRLRATAVAAEIDRGNKNMPLLAQHWNAVYAYLAERNPPKSLQIMEAALEKYPLEQFAPLDRPYRQIAQFYAIFGMRDKVDHYLRLLEQHVPVELRNEDNTGNDFIAGALALSDKNYAEAIAHWRKASQQRICDICMDVELAMAFEQAGMADSARARLEHYVNTPDTDGIWEDAYKLGSAYERLADLFAAAGDRQKALQYAGKFVTLWQSADPELQPRVRAKREMIRQLQQS